MRILKLSSRIAAGFAGILAYTYFKTKRGDPYSMLTVSPTLLAMAHRPDVNVGLENYTPLALFAIDPQTIMEAALERAHQSVGLGAKP
jgi:tripartite-type tricarboxylate transporter receptor subunit TctC